MRQLKITKQVNNRDIASLDRYLHVIGRVDLISAEEEVKLAQRIKHSDEIALEKLTMAILRFVVSVSKQYQNQGLSLPDLINEGNPGMIKAAGRFDETRGFKFISYAVWWIRQFILQALAEQSRIVRLPPNKIGALNRLKKVSLLLEQDLGRNLEPKEIANKLEIPVKQVKTLLKNSGRHLSVDALLIQDEDNTMLDMMGSEDGPTPEKGLLYESLRKEIEHAVSTLSYRDADVIRFFMD